MALTVHPPSSAEVKERVELYTYSSSGPSWPVPLPFLPAYICNIFTAVLGTLFWENRFTNANIVWNSWNICRVSSNSRRSVRSPLSLTKQGRSGGGNRTFRIFCAVITCIYYHRLSPYFVLISFKINWPEIMKFLIYYNSFMNTLSLTSILLFIASHCFRH
jgi:hypothetical protein